MATPIYVPPPPRLTGNPQTDIQILTEWTWQQYQVLAFANPLAERFDAIAAVSKLESSASTTQIVETVNAIIDAARLGSTSS